MAKLNQLGLTLANVELGGIDAEADRRLADYFVNTPVVESVLAGRRTLVLGRKGAGKSAIFTQLARLYRDAGIDAGVVQLTPDEYAWAALKEYREQGLLSEQAHTNAWRFTIAVEVAWHLASLNRDWSPQAKDSLETVSDFIADNYGGPVNVTQSARSLLRGIASFNLSAFGMGVNVARSENEAMPLTPAVVDALLEALSTPLEEVGVVVAVDRLDDSWDRSDEAKSLLIGLLKASKSFNDTWGLDRGKGLRVLPFLRTDIYSSLAFDDKDKHRATEIHILWSPDLLTEMLGRRLPDGVDAAELFEPGGMRGGITPLNYIIKRTFLKPRELLQFVDEAIETEGPSATFVSRSAIKDAEPRYSAWKLRDLKQEWGGPNSHFSALLECLRQEFSRYDSLPEFEALISQKRPDLIDTLDMTVHDLMSALHSASVIGVRLGNSGSPRYTCEDASLVLPSAGAVYVHSALHKGLNIRERRNRSSA